MTDHNPTGDPEFDDLVSRMHSDDAGQPQIVEIAQTASMVEFTIPIREHQHPEVLLLRTVADYLEQTERRALIVVNCTYELRNGDVPFLIATLLLSEIV